MSGWGTRQRLYRFHLVALLAFVCASIFSPIAVFAASLPKMERVGVVSIAGGMLYDDHVGFMVFGNKLDRQDVSEWALDEAWEAKMSAALSEVAADAEIVPLSLERASLLIAYPTPEDEKSIVAQYRMPKFKRIKEALQQIASDNQLDAILVLASSSIELAGTNQSLESFGIFSSGGSSATYYYVIAQIHLIDGVTGKPVKSKWLETARHEKGQFGRSPSETAPDELKEKRFAEYSDEEKLALAERFKVMPDTAWVPTLTKLLQSK